MRPVLTAEQMHAADAAAIAGGVPGVRLMESAGAAVAAVVRERFPLARRVAVLCGKGNNGGDGFVVARRLSGLQPTAYLVSDSGAPGADARIQLEALVSSGGRVVEVGSAEQWQQVRGEVRAAELVVDALLGTGLRRAAQGLVGAVIADLAKGPLPPVVAVDIPSGLSSDSGDIPGAALTARVTVAFAAPKLGHVLPPACDRVGELVIADIGIPAPTIESAGARLFLLDTDDVGSAFPPRAASAHKGSFGHVLVIGGSLGKTGAAVLAAAGALRAGAGLVTVATAASALPIVAAARPELMSEPLAATEIGSIDRAATEPALALAAERDAVVLGPGLGTHPATRAFAAELIRRCPRPLVIDADGLNALAAAGLPSLHARSGAAALVLTPHPGEMARLLGCSTSIVQGDRAAAASRLATHARAVSVLKGQRTLIAEPSGNLAVNPTGTPALATAGTGDVLAGIVGALLAKGFDAWRAATAAAYLHGRAGELAAERLGEDSVIAGDVVEAIAPALRALKLR